MPIKKRVVITGAAGFIGSHLAETLLDRDYSVVGIDNLLTGDPSNIAHLAGRDFQFIKHDVTNYIYVEGPVWSDDNDNRATRVGTFLRRHDLDEWPQFWNVLKGDMSIVGPRPERPFFVEQFKHRIPQYMLRHKVKAGITGWAQVNGWRGNTSLEKRIEYDLYYIENWSVRLDLKIMWLTLLRGFFHKHAY